MRVLLFSVGDFCARPNPGYHLIVSLIQDVVAAGNTVHRIGLAEKGLNRHIPEELENLRGFTYDLIEMEKAPNSAFVKRYLNGISYARRARKILVGLKGEYDIVFAASSPTVLYNILAACSVSPDVPLLYNVQDMFPGSTIACGKMGNPLLQSVFYRLQKIAYRKSDVIVAISEDMKRKVVQQGVAGRKVEVIPDWFDDQSVREIPRKDNLFIQKYGMQEGTFYVQYAGTMGFVFDYEMVLNVAWILREHTDIVFQMIGAGSQKDAFIREAKDRHLENIEFLPLEPQEMVPHVYSACDVCFIPLKRGIIGNSVPSKAGLLMACRRAIVTTADADSDYNDLINREHIGIACATDDPQGAADAILKMRDDSAFRESCANAGLAYGRTLYGRAENTGKYIRLMERLVSNGI